MDMNRRPPYRVIHVITRLDRGGSAENTLLTAIGHDRSRFDPVVVAGDPGRWDAQGGVKATEDNCARLAREGVRYQIVSTLTREVNPVKDVRTFSWLLSFFRREKPTIVHTHSSKAGMLGRLAARIARIPILVHTPHGHVFYGHFGPATSWVFLQLERRMAKRTTHLIALTDSERDDHLYRKVGRPDGFAVVPSGIDLQRFRAIAGVMGRRPPGFNCPIDAIVVGSVGWLTPVKGHATLIEAVARLKSSHPRLHLAIVGTGGLRQSLAALAGERGIQDAVTFLGERSDIVECLAGMDIFVLPSLNEGMGRALVEAMAAGRPVVASRVGGIPAIVQDRHSGLLVPPGNPDALASALDELLQRPDWAKELGTVAHQRIDDRFGAPHMVRAVEAIYGEALAAQGLA